MPPIDEVSYNNYASARQSLTLDSRQLAQTVLTPANDLGSAHYALHPELAPLKEVFLAGDLAPILNIGNLYAPTSAAAYKARTARLPASLFSHNSQKALTLSGLQFGGNTGWGGRIADQIGGANARPEFTCINATARSSFLNGELYAPYAVSDTGVERLFDGANSAFGAPDAASLIRSLCGEASNNMFRHDYASLTSKALASSETMASIFSRVPDSQLAELAIQNNELASQLRSIAKIIAGARSLGMRRQVFFVEMRNWDNHSGGRGDFSALAAPLNGFWRLLRRWGLSQKITTFTLSDFGRNLASNGDGTDHGWGTTNFVMGGAVQGGRIFGRPPVVGITTEDMIDGGRLVPSTSTDQLAATLATWMGVNSGTLTSVVPNLVNFDAKSWNLGIFGKYVS